MSAIVAAIRSPTITCLGVTYDYLPRNAKRMIKQMSDLLDPRYNHNAYKTVLRDSNSLPCIPVLGKHTPCWTHELRVNFDI